MKEENETIIKSLNMYGRVPEQYELLNEIEQLNNIIDKQDKDITTLSKGNKKLKNIIDELEKWLKESQAIYGINQQGFSWGVCGDALNKLQELKENKQ